MANVSDPAQTSTTMTSNSRSDHFREIRGQQNRHEFHESNSPQLLGELKAA